VRKVLRWEPPPRRLPRRPYRDSVLLYGGMAILLVVVAAVTGGSIVRLVIGVFFFVAATAWSWRRWRERLREEERRRT